MQDPDDRRVQLSGTQRRVYEDTTKTSITNVTGEDSGQGARTARRRTPEALGGRDGGVPTLQNCYGC